MKRTVTIITVCSLVGLLAFGCTPNTDADKGNNYYRGYSNPYSFDTNGNRTMTRNNTGLVNDNNAGLYDMGYTQDNTFGYTNKVTDTQDTADNKGNYRYNLINNDTGIGMNGTNSGNKESSIKNLCNNQPQVEDTSVAVNGDTCYVGLDLEGNSNLSEKTKEQLSTSIKRLDPNINRVYFTTDENAINKLMNTTKNGTNTNWNEIENLFR
ncbi:MAG: YhcN/YlaJ family sporulation lipoprotein [Eubacteriales bacterium]